MFHYILETSPSHPKLREKDLYYKFSNKIVEELCISGGICIQTIKDILNPKYGIGLDASTLSGASDGYLWISTLDSYRSLCAIVDTDLIINKSFSNFNTGYRFKEIATRWKREYTLNNII